MSCLPAGDLGDRPERLERAAQERGTATDGIEQRLRLGRWLARGQRHVDGQDRGAVRGGREEPAGDLVGGRDLGRQRAVREVVDEDEDVVGTRRRHRLEHGPIGGPGAVGAPRVERVPDVAHGRQRLEDAGPRRVGDRRQVEPGPRHEVGDQRRLAGRHGHDAGPPATDPPAGPAHALDQLGRLEQLVEVAAADDPGRVERGIGDPRLARQRARSGRRPPPGPGRSARP